MPKKKVKKKDIKPRKPYKSFLEQDLADGALRGMPYESQKVMFTDRKERTYNPDFIFSSKRGTIKYYVEAKGRFRTVDEARKYLAIRESLNLLEELVFIFDDRKGRVSNMPGARRRKDGTKMKITEWADKHKFSYCLYSDAAKFIKYLKKG